MVSNETICAMALSMMFPNRLVGLKQLYQRVGCAAKIVEKADSLDSVVPDLNLNSFSIDRGQLNDFLKRAEAEAKYIEDHGMACISMDMATYPQRLLEVCDDAPLVLYYCGTADLNTAKIISVVGTRNSTEYGRDMVNRIIGELASFYPDLVVVSGLAYGTDINAHRAALDNGLMTVGVLAHGLDRIYPTSHRNTASRMIKSGGLLTEFPIGVKPETYNFLRRNRIVAGLSEATLVVESKERGGSLSTARLANSYNLQVLACPGRATDSASAGTNRLIRSHSAVMITSAGDMIETLGWQKPESGKEALPSLFDVPLEGDEKTVYDLLDTDGKHVNSIVSESGLAISTVMAALSELEFNGLARQLPGSKWRKVQ